MKLYEIPAEIENLTITVDEETGEVDPECVEELDSLHMALKEKALSCAARIKSELAAAHALREEAKNLRVRAERHSRSADGLRQYMSHCLRGQLDDGARYADSRSEVRWGTSTRVEVLDEARLPEELLRVKSEPDKKQIRAVLKLRPDSLPGVARLRSERQIRVS